MKLKEQIDELKKVIKLQKDELTALKYTVEESRNNTFRAESKYGYILKKDCLKREKVGEFMENGTFGKIAVYRCDNHSFELYDNY